MPVKHTSKESLSKQSSPERESVSSIVAEMSEVQAEAALLHRQRTLPLLFVKTLLTCSAVFSHACSCRRKVLRSNSLEICQFDPQTYTTSVESIFKEGFCVLFIENSMCSI
jgi:hypothetical protein